MHSSTSVFPGQRSSSPRWRLLVWLALGFVIYFLYGRKHSVLARMRAEGKL